jgi:epoxyqueuosine reductase
MDYLAETREDRLDPQRLLPGARSVVAVALVYNPADEPVGPGARVARYARGRDYHDFMRQRVRTLADFIEHAAGAVSRAAVDTSAVLERDLAARAGLGWIGKNTNLLSPSLGSWFFIGIVLTTAAIEPDAAVPDHCGTCRACLDACPTVAFTAPFVLDARRCISYLTVEHRGPIEPELRGSIGEWLFGCDVCQDVCPWNRRAPGTREPLFRTGMPESDPVAVLGLDVEAFRAQFRGTALRRARRSGLRRNAALVLGNRFGDAGASEATSPRERGDAASRMAAIGALTAALSDDDADVRDAARWALGRIAAL